MKQNCANFQRRGGLLEHITGYESRNSLWRHNTTEAYLL